MYEEIRNGRIINETDESDNYQGNGLYCYSTTSCGQVCSDWNFTSNSYMKTAGVTFVGIYEMEERLAATGNYRTQDGRYETYINATFSVYDTLALAEFKTARANDSIYDFFYHYIPKELKCVYTDLVKYLLMLMEIIINFVKRFIILIFSNLSLPLTSLKIPRRLSSSLIVLSLLLIITLKRTIFFTSIV